MQREQPVMQYEHVALIYPDWLFHFAPDRLFHFASS
jgi:hypothetical protein